MNTRATIPPLIITPLVNMYLVFEDSQKPINNHVSISNATFWHTDDPSSVIRALGRGARVFKLDPKSEIKHIDAAFTETYVCS